MRVPGAAEPTPLRSYSLSGDPAAAEYRISVKHEDHGLVSRWLHTHIEPGIARRGGRTAWRLLSHRGQGSGHPDLGGHRDHSRFGDVACTVGRPQCPRRSGGCTPPAIAKPRLLQTEVTTLIESLPHARQLIFFTQTQGRLDQSAIAALGLPSDAAAYLCGPTQFMADMRDCAHRGRTRPRHVSTANCSVRSRRSTPALLTGRHAGRRTLRPERRERDRQSPLPAADLPSAGLPTMAISWTWRKPATCRPVSRAGAESVTCVKPVWSPGRRPMSSRRWSRRADQRC